MKRDFNPVDVKLNIENPSIERGAFYSLCFITESNVAPRTLKVTRLQDLLDNGYSRLDLAYNFCVGVFSQQGMDTVYIRAKRSYESYVEAYNSDDNSIYYFVVLQTKDLTEIEKFNSHLVSSDEMKLQFFSQNVGSKTLKSPKLVNYYQDYTLSGGASVESKDYYLNKAYSGVTVVNKLPLPDYLLGGYGNTAVDYGVRMMVGKDYIWEIDKPNRQIKYARNVVESGWVGSREESIISNSEVTVVATKGIGGKLLRASIKDPKVKIETISRELLKGLGKEALDYAIPLIDPEANDWVLDPDNNRVGYTVPSADSGIGTGADVVNYECYYQGKDQNLNIVLYYVNQNTGGAVFVPSSSGNSGQIVRGDTVVVSSCKRLSDAPPVPSPVETEKSIPIDTVSQQVIVNAGAGHLESKEFLKSIPLFAYLLTGSGTEAVNKAVLDIDPEAADWELDPENNRVKYKYKEGDFPPLPKICFGDICGTSAESTALDYFAEKKKPYTNNGRLITYENVRVTLVDPTDWDAQIKNKGGSMNVSVTISYDQHADGTKVNEITLRWRITGTASAPRDEQLPTDWQHIPIDTVAAQVISNAESGHAPSQEALRLSTVERVDIGEYDEALEAASTEIDTSWKYLPIYDVAVQVKRNSIAGHAESIEAVNNSLPFELPDNDTPWAYVPEETSVTGSTTTIKAKRTFENQKLKSSITVAASASKVGKHLIKGGGSAALAYAVVELLGEGIDWVLDPANNAVKYKEPAIPNDGFCYAAPPSWGDEYYPTAQAACSAYMVKREQRYGGSFSGTASGSGADALCSYRQTANALRYAPASSSTCQSILGFNQPVDDWKYLPIDTVAAQVISNAESGHVPSQEAVKATALEGFVAGEYDAALDAAAVIDN